VVVHSNATLILQTPQVRREGVEYHKHSKFTAPSSTPVQFCIRGNCTPSLLTKGTVGSNSKVSVVKQPAVYVIYNGEPYHFVLSALQRDAWFNYVAEVCIAVKVLFAHLLPGAASFASYAIGTQFIYSLRRNICFIS
jgi:hypothetical protein